MHRPKNHKKPGSGSKLPSSSSSSSSATYFPSQWSSWEWNLDRGCSSRYRLKAPNEYEYEDRDVQSESQLPADPRTPQLSFGPGKLPESNGPYPPTGYDAISVDELARGISDVSLDGPCIKTQDPGTVQEEFDHHYRVHPAWEFKFGRVFKILWSEPGGNGSGIGNDGDEISNPGTITERQGKYGEVLHQKVRRFVIIKAVGGHCICLAINTYGKQGVMKHGVHATHHTIIHSQRKPVYFQGEKAKGLTKTPLVMVPHNPRHKLTDTSRLNYAKPYTVECNVLIVKVWFIGRIHPDSEWQLTTDYNLTNPQLKPRGNPPSQRTTTQYAGGGVSNAPYPAPHYALSSTPSMSDQYSQNAAQSWTARGHPSQDISGWSGPGTQEPWSGSHWGTESLGPIASGGPWHSTISTQPSYSLDRSLQTPGPYYANNQSSRGESIRASGQYSGIPRADEPAQLEPLEEEAVDASRAGSRNLVLSSASTSRSGQNPIISEPSNAYYESSHEEDIYGVSDHENEIPATRGGARR
ncbi:hypothetical protein VTL71DRAFT_3821 [Oculimacula yallundae]|uniref:DUF6590 domain-containing protein n=1 Tax=Oculimacula yallundae TaxID=86028 RepID=A0ABR4C468_9HELO